MRAPGLARTFPTGDGRKSARRVHWRLADMRESAMRREQPNDRELLERLCVYRRLYQLKSSYDSESAMSVMAAVAYGEALMRHARTRGAWLRQTA
jgi:hypothetical protein